MTCSTCWPFFNDFFEEIFRLVSVFFLTCLLLVWKLVRLVDRFLWLEDILWLVWLFANVYNFCEEILWFVSFVWHVCLTFLPDIFVWQFELAFVWQFGWHAWPTFCLTFLSDNLVDMADILSDFFSLIICPTWRWGGEGADLTLKSKSPDWQVVNNGFFHMFFVTFPSWLLGFSWFLNWN